MLYVILAWRNLWRNGKRTSIAAASVLFAVLLAVVMRSGQNGSYAYMIDSSARLFTGYLQIQTKGYWDNRSLNKSFVLPRLQWKEISQTPNITSVAPRLESYSLVSKTTNTKVAEIVGVDPSLEDRMTGLARRVVAGRYLKAGSDGVLVAQGLAGSLKISVGDRVVIYGQGYHGQTAAVRLPVSGIVKLPFPDMNNSLVYLNLAKAQEVFSAPGRMTSFAIMIDDIGNLSSVQKEVQQRVDGNLTIMTWDEMMPDLVQSIELDNAIGIAMIIILYSVIAFGIFGTVMMMTSERVREFGILISVGMRRSKLACVTTLETVFISLLGVTTGILGSIPIVSYLHYHPLRMSGDAAKAFEVIGVEPIMNFSIASHIFIYQAVVVLLIALATAIYPVLFIRHLQPAKTLHG